MHDDPAYTHLHEENKEAGQQFAVSRYCENIGKAVGMKPGGIYTYIFDSRPLANKRRLGKGRNGVCAVGLPSKSKRGMRENRSAKGVGNWSGNEEI